jgi:hypothetical protein
MLGITLFSLPQAGRVVARLSRDPIEAAPAEHGGGASPPGGKHHPLRSAQVSENHWILEPPDSTNARRNYGSLLESDFEGKQAPALQHIRGAIHKVHQDRKPAIPRNKRTPRFPVPHLGLELGEFLLRDVRRIGHEDVKALVGPDDPEGNTLPELNPILESMGPSVFTGHLQCRLRSVGGEHVAEGSFLGEGQRNRPAACAHV